MEQQKRYYYRLPISTHLGKQFRSLHRECMHAEQAAERFAKKVGAQQYYPASSAFAGGVMCVSFADDARPDEQLWRSCGKDADGIEMWEPRCNKREGSIDYNPNHSPIDTATRLYAKRPAIDGRLHYIELYSDEPQHQSRSTKRGKQCQLSRTARQAIRIERERLLLPTVLTDRFYKLLQVDFLDAKKIEPVTPVFFDFDGYYYLCMAYPCHADGLQLMQQEAFMQRKEDLLRCQRDIEAMNQNTPINA